ncbi:MAG: cation transporter [Ectothiorhodospiraceae bacterium]|nr:cation transporter [Ectothiorhodospiraceae bacterium]
MTTQWQTTPKDEGDWRSKRRVTLIGAAVNLVLSIGKIAFGLLGHSQALVADGVHSLSDLVSDGIVLAAARYGSQKADHDHPYGHARIETVATVAIGLLLLLVAAGFVLDAGSRLLQPETLPHPGWLALIAAVVSVLLKELLFRYTRLVARQTGSALILANAWHHRSDALSSLVVIGGIAGALLGAVWLDAVAAILVAAMIGRMGWDFVWSGTRELVDTGLEQEQLKELGAQILAVPGVKNYRQLRSRRMGPQVLLDVHVQLQGQLSLAEASSISERVRNRLLALNPDVVDVLVIPEPVSGGDAQ